MGGNRARGRGRGDGNRALANNSSSRRGRGSSRGSQYQHDDRIRKSDHTLKNKQPVGGRSKGHSRGRGKGKGRGRYDREDDLSRVRRVTRVEAENMMQHCLVAKAHGSAVTCMAMTEQGIYTTSSDKSLKRWKPVKDGEGRFTLHPEVTVPLADSCFTLHHFGGWLFCGLLNGDIQAFSQEGKDLKLQGHRRQVTCIIAHQNVLITGGNDCSVKLWQMDPGTKQFSCTHTLEESLPGQIRKLHVLGNNLVVAGSKGLAIVDLQTLKVSKILPPTQSVSEVLEYEGHIIVAYSEGSFRIFDAEFNLKTEVAPLPAGFVLTIAGLESGPRVLCGHANGKVSTIHLPSFQFGVDFQTGCRVDCILCVGHDGIFLIGAQDGSLQLWQKLPST